jgi:hypothetical protein
VQNGHRRACLYKPPFLRKLMNRILIYIFSQTKFGKFIDGKKTLIGAFLIIVAAALHALEQIAPLFPQYPWLKDASKSLGDAVKASEPVLDALGLSFLTIGVLHKGAKAKLPPSE